MDTLLQSITNARKGILEPRVVAPKLIMDALTKSMPSFPKDTISPFSLSKNSINLIYRICDVHVYLENNVLGYVITLPLIGRGMFKAYKMIPIPMFLENGKFAYIHTEENNLCFDQTRQYYYGISSTEFDNCKNVDSQTKICKQKHPLLSSHLHESCAVKLLQQEVEIPKNCDTRLAQIKNTIWTQLDNNEWLYFAPVAERVTVLCNDRDPLDITLTGVGKITLRERCKGYSAFALLQSSVIIKAKALKQEDKLSRVRLDWDCLEELGIRFNTSNILHKLEFKQIASHLDDLKHANYKISELEKEINEQEWKNHQLKKHHAYSVVVYILISIFAMYTVYKFYQLYKYLRNRLFSSRSTRALTAPLREVQTSAKLDGSGNTVNINIKTSNESISLGQGEVPLQNSSQSIEEDAIPRRSLRPRVSKSYF